MHLYVCNVPLDIPLKVPLPVLDQLLPKSHTVGIHYDPGMTDEIKVENRYMEWFTIYLAFVSCGQFIELVRGGNDK